MPSGILVRGQDEGVCVLCGEYGSDISTNEGTCGECEAADKHVVECAKKRRCRTCGAEIWQEQADWDVLCADCGSEIKKRPITVYVDGGE